LFHGTTPVVFLRSIFGFEINLANTALRLPLYKVAALIKQGSPGNVTEKPSFPVGFLPILPLLAVLTGSPARSGIRCTEPCKPKNKNPRRCQQGFRCTAASAVLTQREPLTSALQSLPVTA
jgi:hypothetical protein